MKITNFPIGYKLSTFEQIINKGLIGDAGIEIRKDERTLWKEGKDSMISIGLGYPDHDSDNELTFKYKSHSEGFKRRNQNNF